MAMSMLSAKPRPLFISLAVVASFPAVLLLGACNGPRIVLRPVTSHEIACLADKAFRVQVDDERALLTTSTAAYALLRRSSSIGRKYASGDVTLILDDDRAVLVGAEGGPFHKCRQR